MDPDWVGSPSHWQLPRRPKPRDPEDGSTAWGSYELSVVPPPKPPLLSISFFTIVRSPSQLPAAGRISSVTPGTTNTTLLWTTRVMPKLDLAFRLYRYPCRIQHTWGFVIRYPLNANPTRSRIPSVSPRTHVISDPSDILTRLHPCV